MRRKRHPRGFAPRRVLTLALLLVVLVLPAAGQTPGRPRGAAVGPPGVPAPRLARLRRGINLSHWFAQSRDYSARHLRGHTTRGDIDLVRRLGFDHVRFTVDPAPLFDEERPSRLDREHLRHLDAALDMLTASGLGVVLDLHPADEFKIRLRAEDRFVSALADFWRALARHLSRRDPERLFLEILNEPMVEDPRRWTVVQARLAAAVREGAPRHTIVATGPRWSAVEQLLLTEPLADRNVVYNFHFYEPHTFTHQGATWGADFWPHLKNLPYPSSPGRVAQLLSSVENGPARAALKDYGDERWDAARVEREVAAAAGWARRHGVALTCNEFGVYRKYAPPADRLRWIKDAREAFERHGIGWTMWDFAGDFGVAVRRGRRVEPDAETAAALGLSHLGPLRRTIGGTDR